MSSRKVFKRKNHDQASKVSVKLNIKSTNLIVSEDSQSDNQSEPEDLSDVEITDSAIITEKKDKKKKIKPNRLNKTSKKSKEKSESELSSESESESESKSDKKTKRKKNIFRLPKLNKEQQNLINKIVGHDNLLVYYEKSDDGTFDSTIHSTLSSCLGYSKDKRDKIISKICDKTECFKVGRHVKYLIVNKNEKKRLLQK